jgi:NADPH-dependent 2,4-dienoyl-CoA reductase/sulfur reductase-like enzyme
VAPSDVPHDVREGDVQQVTPTPLTEDGMRTLVGGHAAGALRCKQAGFDMIELQGGHDYLLYQFLSPLDNKRADAYGGTLRNRARFPLQVVSACVTALGDGCPVSFRFSADEFTPGGFTLDDALELAPLLQRAGVSLINVSAGSARSVPIPWLITTPMAYPAGLFVPLARQIKRVVSIPVAVVGRLHDPRYAESVLNDGAADFIVLGRALLADPSWPLKAQASAADRIRPCIACNTCVEHLRSGDTVSCLVNPATAKESFEVPPDTTRGEGRRALVIGGGPAGLTAAAELAADGYLVTLWEKEQRLGGRLQHIPEAPYFQVVETSPQPFQDLISFLTGELRRAGVQVELGRRADARDVEDFGADIVIDATGAVYRVPGTLHLLRLPGARYLAARPRLRKLFFKMLRNRRRGLATRISQSPVMIVGDASGSRGVEAAIKTAHAAIQQMRVNSQERAPPIGAIATAVKDGCTTSREQTA